MSRPLIDSTSLKTIPAVDLTSCLIITPTTYASWAAILAAMATKLDLLLTPGDYTGLGPMLVNHDGGTSGRPKTIRYYDTDATTHPYLRSAAKQARIDGFKFSNPRSSYWFLQGIYVNGTTLNSGLFDGVVGTVVDFCHIENSDVYGIRVLSVIDCTIQRSVIHDIQPSSPGVGDSVGVQFRNTDTFAGNCLGSMLLDNEIFNCGDSVALTAAPSGWRPVELYMEGNDCYITSAKYIADTNTTQTENAIDIKCGSDRSESTVLYNNRFWGFRQNNVPTALGEAVVVQKYARNLLFDSNIVSDCPKGMKDENWPTVAGTDIITYTADFTTGILTKAHSWSTGAGPMLLTTTGTCPAGFSTLTRYWIIVLSSTTFKLASSYENAINGTAVAFTTNGTGTNKVKIDPSASRSCTWRGNQFYDIRDYATSDAGAVWKPITDMVFEDNYVSNCTYLFSESPGAYYNPTFVRNIITDVDFTQRLPVVPTIPYVALLNTTRASLGRFDTYERRRWTGPETVFGAISLAPEVGADPDPITDNPFGDPPVPVIPPPPLPPIPVRTASHRGAHVPTATGSVSHRATNIDTEDQ